MNCGSHRSTLLVMEIHTFKGNSIDFSGVLQVAPMKRNNTHNLIRAALLGAFLVFNLADVLAEEEAKAAIELPQGTELGTWHMPVKDMLEFSELLRFEKGASVTLLASNDWVFAIAIADGQKGKVLYTLAYPKTKGVSEHISEGVTVRRIRNGQVHRYEVGDWDKELKTLNLVKIAAIDDNGTRWTSEKPIAARALELGDTEDEDKLLIRFYYSKAEGLRSSQQQSIEILVDVNR